MTCELCHYDLCITALHTRLFTLSNEVFWLESLLICCMNECCKITSQHRTAVNVPDKTASIKTALPTPAHPEASTPHVPRHQ